MDGFLTPFKLKQYSTTLDTYIYAPDDEVIEGEVEEGRLYEENEFNIKFDLDETLEIKKIGDIKKIFLLDNYFY